MCSSARQSRLAEPMYVSLPSATRYLAWWMPPVTGSRSSQATEAPGHVSTRAAISG